jgi:hypothetical protein
MNTPTAFEFNAAASTAVAAAIVALGGLALDQGHIAAAPRGIVEIGALVPVEAAPQVATLLPEVVVSAARA